MTRKAHLQHTVHNGPTCQTGRAGAGLRGEHITYKTAEFLTTTNERCAKCMSSKLFAFLSRKADQAKADQAKAEDWEPEADDAWMKADDALIASRKAAKGG